MARALAVNEVYDLVLALAGHGRVRDDDLKLNGNQIFRFDTE